MKDRYLGVVLLLSYVLVWIKKWEPGGNIDSLWYSAISKSIYLSGDYFHFHLWDGDRGNIYDHMPLTYWLVATLFRIFGPSDFVARLYPGVCSFCSYLFVFFIGRRLRSSFFGFCAVVMYALCFDSTHWNATLMQDVPLTLFFLGAFYFFLRAEQDARFYYFVALFTALGVFTKGPIIGALPLGIGAWIVFEKRGRLILTPHFFGAIGILILLLSIPFLPALSFDGRPYYSIFFQAKRGYVTAHGLTFARWVSHLAIPVKLASIPMLFAAWALPLMRNADCAGFRLALFVALAILLPFSFCYDVFPHYLLPFYPFLSLVAALKLDRLCFPYRKPFGAVIGRLSWLTVLVLALFPIKTSGRRNRELLNLVDLIKFDERLLEKTVYYVGPPLTTEEIVQTFAFYGSIFIKPVSIEESAQIDLRKAYVVGKKEAIAQISGRMPACFLETSRYCVLADPRFVQYRFPDKELPHEVF